nr:DNA-directed RNA polymerase I subunit RPA49 [Tanacetum cinerariifolium]
IFRLEPRFDDEVNPADENSKVEEADEKEKTFLFSTKKSEQTDEEERKSLACIYSYINHLIKFNDKHSRFSSAKHHKLPNILTQKLNDMFAITEPESRLSDNKRDLLISYVLVLTLIVDNFKTEFSDIAKDLRMPTRVLRPHYEFLGCKFTIENNISCSFKVLGG